MTTPLRLIFGGSSRPHHLAMSRFVAGALAGVGLFTPTPLWFPWRSLWMVAAIACAAQEWWATSDRDLTENCKARGFAYWWWIPYGRAIRHRGVLSHGLAHTDRVHHCPAMRLATCPAIQVTSMLHP